MWPCRKTESAVEVPRKGSQSVSVDGGERRQTGKPSWRMSCLCGLLKHEWEQPSEWALGARYSGPHMKWLWEQDQAMLGFRNCDQFGNHWSINCKWRIIYWVYYLGTELYFSFEKSLLISTLHQGSIYLPIDLPITTTTQN